MEHGVATVLTRSVAQLLPADGQQNQPGKAKLARQVLTDRFIRSLAAADKGKRYDEQDAVVPGLALVVTDTGAKTFVFIGRFPGSRNPTRRKIGRYGALSLEDARTKARAWIELLQKGIDPKILERESQRKEQRRRANTFGAAVEDFIKEKLSTERKGKEVERDIRREFLPLWAERPVTDITAIDVQEVVRAIKARGAPHQARNILGIAKRLFEWIVDQQVYELSASPCERLKPTKLIGKKRGRARVLTDAEIFAFWRIVRRLPYPFGPLYQLLLLTGLRLNEVADASWKEIDRKKAIWIIPADRMKGRDEEAREHVVPITAEIDAILDTLPRFKSGQHLFSVSFGKTSIWVGDKIKRRIDFRMLRTLRALARKAGDDPATVELPRWTNHDLRRTLRTGLSALRVDHDVREAVLAHAIPGIAGVYDRHDYLSEKRDALERWAAHLRGITEPTPSNVIKIGAVG